MFFNFRNKSLTALLIFLFSFYTAAGSAIIEEKHVNIDTYLFSDPDPTGTLSSNPEIYPYFKFDQYSHEAVKKNWKVITLENDYIKLFILPEVGGKIWGAIEKSTGKDFIYKNDTLKFRNIAARGPWTSGGIEFNFASYGHAPSTATPVDYVIQKHKDGSVSCTVGTMDLTSRTQWRVKIRLPVDKAYFETHASWFNPTQYRQLYYTWMNAAAWARDDLELFFPGNQHIDHNGSSSLWPISETGRNLANYNENNFGADKSYHITGAYENYYAGYYHNDNIGFGHRARYSDMPGQKLWLWSQARNGAIWEDLLTDSNGQYIEVQSGRLFNQYDRDSHQNSINKVGFSPQVFDHWKETWFPVKGIGGINATLADASLNLRLNNGELNIGINALADITDDLVILAAGKEIYREKLNMRPMGVFTTKVNVSGEEFKILIGKESVDYAKAVKPENIKRVFNPKNTVLSEKQSQLQLAEEAYVTRQYNKALMIYQSMESKQQCELDCWSQLSELYFRMTKYDMALKYANKILHINTYNPRANFLAGQAYRGLKDIVNAKESFGWAARDNHSIRL